MFNNFIIKFQSYILTNYGNTQYRYLSKDNMLKNIPKNLYEIWYCPYSFSFRKFKDVKELPYLHGKALLNYFFNILMCFIKLKIILKKIERGN